MFSPLEVLYTLNNVLMHVHMLHVYCYHNSAFQLANMLLAVIATAGLTFFFCRCPWFQRIPPPPDWYKLHMWVFLLLTGSQLIVLGKVKYVVR